LLDEYRGTHPYTTWSTVTTHHAWELIDQMQVEAVAVLGVTRCYTTRHGEGPLPTYSAALTTRLQDPGNPWNRWQGNLRCGWLDLALLRYAAAVEGRLDGLVVNHLDQMTDSETLICDAYQNVTLSPTDVPDLSRQQHFTEQLKQAKPVLASVHSAELVERLSAIAPVALTASGATHEERRLLGLRFRSRNTRTA
jgi:adenylosuccinate synthase